jgi:capsular polysaccharide transport system ATP-binding protein
MENRGISRDIFKNVNFSCNFGEKWGVMGNNGVGKSTFIRLLSGTEKPNSGSIIKNMNISWPLALGETFQGSLTGRDNIRLICRLYNINIKLAMPKIEEFTGLGSYLKEPVKNYSTGMKARLAFALSMAVEFDCYLIDEVLSVGDHNFINKCEYELFGKRYDRAMIIVSHDLNLIRKFCQKAIVIKDSKFHQFENIEEAILFHENKTIL